MLSIAASTQDRGAYDEKGRHIGWWKAAKVIVVVYIELKEPFSVLSIVVLMALLPESPQFSILLQGYIDPDTSSNPQTSWCSSLPPPSSPSIFFRERTWTSVASVSSWNSACVIT